MTRSPSTSSSVAIKIPKPKPVPREAVSLPAPDTCGGGAFSDADVRLASRHLLEKSDPFELLPGQAVTLANLENRPEVFDWYIEESLSDRVEELPRETATLAESASVHHPDGEVKGIRSCVYSV
jgi:hypothetical protein